MLETLLVLLTLGAQAQSTAQALAVPPATAPEVQVQPQEADPAPAETAPTPTSEQPTGKFTTAQEVKPILTATKPNWVGVRDFGGNDLVYVTQIWAWRCGLAAMSIGINDEPLQNWPLPPCRADTASPNAILPEDGVPYLTMRAGSVQKVVIELTYDDMTTDRAEFPRATVLIP